MQSKDADWMKYAFKLAEQAEAAGEVPIGAVLVKEGELIAEGWNQPISACDPSAHAEVVALREGAKRVGNYRLLDTTLYVTLEPCVMCVGAMVHARIKRLVFGAYDPKAGAVESVFSLLRDQQKFNHRMSYTGGVLSAECGHLLSHFFKKRRG